MKPVEKCNKNWRGEDSDNSVYYVNDFTVNTLLYIVLLAPSYRTVFDLRIFNQSF